MTTEIVPHPAGTPTSLPPPDGEPAWSIITLAEYLCTPPHEVFRLLEARSRRCGCAAVYLGPHCGCYFEVPKQSGYGVPLVDDAYVTDAAVTYLLDVLPVGPQAREVVAAGEQGPGDDFHRMAAHLVKFLGGAR